MDLGHMNVVLKWIYLYVGSVFDVECCFEVIYFYVEIGCRNCNFCSLLFCLVLFCRVVSVCCLAAFCVFSVYCLFVIYLGCGMWFQVK